MQSWYVPQLSFWFGGNIFDPVQHKLTLDSPATLHAYQWIQSYAKRLGGQALLDFQNSLGNIFDSPQNPFLTGNLVMEQQGPWMANYIRHLKPSMSEVLCPTSEEWKLPDRTANYAWGVAPFPSAVPGLKDVSYNPFDALMIPVGARHKAAAFEFMAYVESAGRGGKALLDALQELPVASCEPGVFETSSESLHRSLSEFGRQSQRACACRRARSGRR